MANENFGLPETPEEKIARLEAQNATLVAQLAVKAADDDAPANEGVGSADAQGFPRKYVRLQVFRSQNPQDSAYVTPGINGYVIRIERGKDVIVPSVFAEVLEHCIEEVTTQSEGGLVTRPSHRFPFSVLGEATEAEYLAFQTKMHDMGKGAAVTRG